MDNLLGTIVENLMMMDEYLAKSDANAAIKKIHETIMLIKTQGENHVSDSNSGRDTVSSGCDGRDHVGTRED